MTKPTLSLDASEYRALVIANLMRAQDFVGANGAVSAEHLKSFCEHMDRVKTLAAAWHFAAPPVTQAETTKAGVQEAAPATNGAHEPKKRRGGWPAGKPRKTAEAEQQH